MSTDYEKLVSKIRYMGAVDQEAIELESRVMPLIATLKRGKNYFTPDQFRDVMYYLLPQDEETKRAAAMRTGTYKPGGLLEIIRVKWLNEDRLATVADLSRQTGIPYMTLKRKLVKLGLPVKRVGKLKFYDIDMLRGYLEAEKV